MPIVILRHKKLYVAKLAFKSPTVLNFEPLQIRDLKVVWDRKEKEYVVRIFMTWLRRRQKLRRDQDSVWEARKSGLTITHYQWKGWRTQTAPGQHYEPLVTLTWNDQDNYKSIFEQFEQGIATRPIIERYLHEHTVNPQDYSIFEFDFTGADLVTNQLAVRSMEEVLIAEKEDKSCSADAWEKLLFGS